MPFITVTIARIEDAFFAFTTLVDGYAAGGYTYGEVKTNIGEIPGRQNQFGYFYLGE